MPIRQGEVYWLEDCPTLDGGQVKCRPVIVLAPPEILRHGSLPVLVVACSSTVLETEEDRIPLPNTADTPQARTGLTRKTWAVPRWFLPVERDRLRRPAGHITRPLLERVIEAVEKRMME